MSRGVDWGSRAKKTASTQVLVDDRVVVDAPPATVWARLEDIPTVAQCLPGLVAGSLEPRGADRFHAQLKHSALGFNALWDLDASVRLVAEQRTLELQLDGVEPRLGLTLNGSATVVTESEASGSVLLYRGRVDVAGSLAGLGSPIIRGVVSDTLAQFVKAVGGTQQQRGLRGRIAALLARIRALLGRTRRS